MHLADNWSEGQRDLLTVLVREGRLNSGTGDREEKMSENMREI